MSGDEPKAIVSINIPYTYVSTGTNNIQDIIMLKTPRNADIPTLRRSPAC